MKFHICYENIVYGFMDKCDVMWYWWRHTRKNLWSHAYRLIRRKYYWIFIKVSEYIYFSTGRSCLVFGENRKSLSIQNGGPKFAKFWYLWQISQFRPDFKTKYIFHNQHDCLITKIVCVLLSTPGLRILLSV